MIRAAALSYAVIFSLLIGMICSGLLFITSTQKKIEIIYTGSEALLLDSYAAIQYAKNTIAPGDSSVLFHPSGDTSKLKHLKWGVFSVVTSITFKNDKNKKRCAFLGKTAGRGLATCYIPGNIEGLKITGNTLLEGNFYLPNAQVEKAFISGKTYINNKLVYGTINKSENTLPSLHKTYLNSSLEELTSNLNNIKFKLKDSVFSFFGPSTLYQQITPIYITQNLKGNVVIQSFDSIYVASSAQLEHVILCAPIVRFESGFKGSVQVIAQEQIVLEKDVQLQYPSACILNESKTNISTTRPSILLDSLAEVRGGILLTSQKNDFRNLPVLNVQPTGTIAGMIYNSGESRIRGSIIGFLYSNKLSTHYGGGIYDNHLVDVTISSIRLPNKFCIPHWLESNQKSALTIIEWV